MAGTGTGIRMASASAAGNDKFFKLTSSERSFFLCCDSAEDKDMWVRAIQQAIDDFKRLNAHVELYVLDCAAVSVSVSSFFTRWWFCRNFNCGSTPVVHQVEAKHATAWVPNDVTNNCTLCQVEFSFLTRRHHCRLWYALSFQGPSFGPF
jgi:hypothetical protein